VSCAAPTRDVSVAKSKKAVTDSEARRFLEQATFGPTFQDAQDVVDQGIEGWLINQIYAVPASPWPTACYPASAECSDAGTFDYLAVLTTRPGTCVNECQRDNYTVWKLQNLFYQYALGAPDQLRQRMAFALDQIVVTSGQDAEVNYGYRMAP